MRVKIVVSLQPTKIFLNFKIYAWGGRGLGNFNPPPSPNKNRVKNINNLYFAVNYLYGTIEKIDDSKDRYLVIDKDRLINKENIDLFYDLWDAIINKIKYLRGDYVMFDDNEVIIKNWNKIRFSSDVFIPNDVFD